MTEHERKRLYYRTKPEFREKKLRAVKARHEALSSDPDYRRLIQLRKDIYRLRESYNARVEHAERLEKRLVKLGRELARVERRWKGKRGKSR